MVIRSGCNWQNHWGLQQCSHVLKLLCNLPVWFCKMCLNHSISDHGTFATVVPAHKERIRHLNFGCNWQNHWKLQQCSYVLKLLCNLPIWFWEMCQKHSISDHGAFTTAAPAHTERPRQPLYSVQYFNFNSTTHTHFPLKGKYNANSSCTS